MKSIFRYITQSLTLIFLLAGIAVFTSCEDEDATSSGLVELKSFGPVGVKHGEMIQFVGVNLNQVTAIVFANGATVSSFVSKTPTRIEIIVPNDAEAGKVTLKTPKGDVVSKTIISFDVPVVINSITAEAKPGTNITIIGDFLNWVESVTFTSDVSVEKDDFVSQSQTQLVITVPMEAQSGFLIFSSGGTEPMIFSSAEELTVTLPSVTAINPQAIRHASNLTVTGTNLDLVTEIIFNEGITILASNFVNQSETEIVVTVPSPVETGTIILKQKSPVDIITSQVLEIILPVGTSVTPTPAVPGVDNITIAGTDLDLVAQLMLPGGITVSSTSFISQSATEIVMLFPEDAKSGVVNYRTIHGYENTLGVAVIIPSAGLPPLLVSIYEESLTSLMGQGGGWNSSTDFASAENAREGSLSMKVTYTANWGGGGQGGTWGMSPIPVAGTEVFAFSVYGGAGTDGKQLNVNVKSSGDNIKSVTIKEGQWTDFEIPLSELGNMTEVTEVWFQNHEWLGSIYIDRVGFGFPAGPPELTIVAYDDAVSSLFGGGGGWGETSTDFANIENVRQGSSAIKATFVNSWGGAAQLGTWGKDDVAIAGMTYFAFSVYGGDGTDGKELNVNIKLDTDNPQIVVIKEGEWVDVAIPIADFGGLTAIKEIWFQDRGFAGDVYIDYMGFR
jgi:hypothetical protein